MASSSLDFQLTSHGAPALWNLPRNTVYWGKRGARRFDFDPTQNSQTVAERLAVVLELLHRRQHVFGQPLTKFCWVPAGDASPMVPSSLAAMWRRGHGDAL